MISTIRKAISYALYYSGIVSMMYKAGNKKTLILVYHRILNIDFSFGLDRSVVSASVGNFRKQMEYLANKYHVISLEEYLQYYKQKKNPPKNSVIITFDDGYRDNYKNAYPVLKKHNIPAAIFLSTDAIDKKKPFWWDKVAFMINKTAARSFELEGLGRYTLKNKTKTLKEIQYKLKNIDDVRKNILIARSSHILKVELHDKETFLGWDEIREMSKNKISFGAHTESHPILTNIPLKDAASEILNSKNMIERRLKKRVTLFAYPNGHESDFNDDIKKILKENGFECALTYIPGWVSVDSDLFAVKRMNVRYEEDMVMFKTKIAGFGVIEGRLYRFIMKIKENIRKIIQKKK